MAQAIIRGAFDAKLLAPFEVVVCEPDLAKRRVLETWGVRAHAPYADALQLLGSRVEGDERTRDGQVLLAVKPQMLDDVARELRPLLEKQQSAGHRRVVISILAGTPIAKIRARLGERLPVVRVMPNTPAQVRLSMSAVSVGEGTTFEQAQFAKDLFQTLGEVIAIDESLIDAFTAVAGSGPAYLFYLAEMMIASARELGFDQITADRVVRQTLLGSSTLLAHSHELPQALRAQVTSKGGTTAAATRVLDEAQIGDVFLRAITAARDRGREIQGHFT